jgi:hypothetical protein
MVRRGSNDYSSFHHSKRQNLKSTLIFTRTFDDKRALTRINRCHAFGIVVIRRLHLRIRHNGNGAFRCGRMFFHGVCRMMWIGKNDQRLFILSMSIGGSTEEFRIEESFRKMLQQQIAQLPSSDR